MSKAAMIKAKIDKIEVGKVITYDDFADLKSNQTVALVLSRLNRQGFIQRLSKGRYYKPKQTKYATLRPSESEILSSILAKNGGYLGGVTSMNRMGLSTQIPSEVVIAGCNSSRKVQIGNLRLKFVKGPQFKFTQDDQNLTDTIEVLKVFKQLTPANKLKAIQKISSLIQKFNKIELKKLIEWSLLSRPYVRALIGSIIEINDSSNPHLKKLRNSLNPLSIYKLGDLSRCGLLTAKTWNIR